MCTASSFPCGLRRAAGTGKRCSNCESTEAPTKLPLTETTATVASCRATSSVAAPPLTGEGKSKRVV